MQLEITHHLLEVDVIGTNSSITASEKGEGWEKALLLFLKMTHMYVTPIAVTCNAANSACEKGVQ